MYKNRKKVLIRGAGDLATGVGVALHRAGFRVIMTEIAVPLTVRREVPRKSSIRNIRNSCGKLSGSQEGTGSG